MKQSKATSLIEPLTRRRRWLKPRATSYAWLWAKPTGKGGLLRYPPRVSLKCSNILRTISTHNMRAVVDQRTVVFLSRAYSLGLNTPGWCVLV